MTGWDTFDRAAGAYRAVRPTYPPAVFDRIEQYAGGLPVGPAVVEIGIGTGQATRQMAERGWRVLGIEPGPDLAETARADLAEFKTLDIRTVRFEDADLPDTAFDLVTAATAWHWVDPVTGFPKAARLLRPGGVIALWWNAHVTGTSDPRWAPIRAVYEDVAPQLARLAPLTPDRPDYDPAAELATSGWFGDIEQHSYPFVATYTTDEFIALIGTYASHRTLAHPVRDRLHGELRRVIEDELGGVATKPYDCVLVLGTVKSATL